MQAPIAFDLDQWDYLNRAVLFAGEQDLSALQGLLLGGLLLNEVEDVHGSPWQSSGPRCLTGIELHPIGVNVITTYRNSVAVDTVGQVVFVRFSVPADLDSPGCGTTLKG